MKDVLDINLPVQPSVLLEPEMPSFIRLQSIPEKPVCHQRRFRLVTLIGHDLMIDAV